MAVFLIGRFLMPLRSRRGDRVRAGGRGPDDPPNKKPEDPPNKNTDPPQHIKKRAPKRGLQQPSDAATTGRRSHRRCAVISRDISIFI